MKTNFKTKRGIVEIHIDEDNYDAVVSDHRGRRIGSIECNLIEDPSAPDGYYLMMAHAFLDGQNGAYLYQGIGTRCIELLLQETGLPICITANDGQVRSDGAHLTGDAPAFADKLEKLGLIFRR